MTVPTANHTATVLLPALRRAGEMPGEVEVITAGRLQVGEENMTFRREKET